MAIVGDRMIDPATGDLLVVAPDQKIVRIPKEMANNSILGSAPWSAPWNDQYQTLKNEMARQAKRDEVKSTRDLGSVIESEQHRSKLIAMRLRLREGERFPFQDLFTSLAGDTVFVFVVQDNQAVTFEDTAAMFPSDQLITQLRLLEK